MYSRSPFSSSIRSNDLSRFHDKPIFDEDMSTHHSLANPRHTLARSFTPLADPYDAILQMLLDSELLTLPKSRSY